MANPAMEDGRLAGAVLVLLDVTERENREQLRREFTANVSHELRTPLTSISGFAELIRDGIAKPQDVQHLSLIHILSSVEAHRPPAECPRPGASGAGGGL